MLMIILQVVLILCASLLGWILGTWIYHAIDLSIKNRRAHKYILLDLYIHKELDKIYKEWEKIYEELRKETK